MSDEATPWVIFRLRLVSKSVRINNRGEQENYRLSEWKHACVWLCTLFSQDLGLGDWSCTVAVQCAGSYHEQGYWSELSTFWDCKSISEHMCILWSDEVQLRISYYHWRLNINVVDGFGYGECFRRSIWSLCSPQARRKRLQGCHSARGTVLQCWEALIKTQRRRQIQRRWDYKECFTKFFVTLLVFGPLSLYTITHGAVHSLTSPCARLTHGLEAGCGVCPTMTELSVRSHVSLF